MPVKLSAPVCSVRSSATATARPTARRSHHPLPSLLRPNEPVGLRSIGGTHLRPIPLKALARPNRDDARQPNLRQQPASIKVAVRPALPPARLDPLRAMPHAARQRFWHFLRRLVPVDVRKLRLAAEPNQPAFVPVVRVDDAPLAN